MKIVFLLMVQKRSATFPSSLRHTDSTPCILAVAYMIVKNGRCRVNFFDSDTLFKSSLSLSSAANRTWSCVTT